MDLHVSTCISTIDSHFEVISASWIDLPSLDIQNLPSPPPPMYCADLGRHEPGLGASPQLSPSGRRNDREQTNAAAASGHPRN
jgi:hypothetical protein